VCNANGIYRYNTGDVCTISTKGNLAVVGRTKELFKSSGFQVSPQELEAYLVPHPDIEEAAVGPTYDKAKGTNVATAYVVLKPQIKDKQAKLQSLQSIVHFLDGKVSGYKKLKGGAFEVTRLPKNGTGKVMRNQVGDHKTGLVYVPAAEPKAKL
jgi:acyl-coenzyme A synthetase/AMP-(fatty) acid ligase